MSIAPMTTPTRVKSIARTARNCSEMEFADEFWEGELMTEGIWLGRGSAVSKLVLGDGGPLIEFTSKTKLPTGNPHIVKPRETLFKFP
jgi:hypothetical protein